MRISPVHLFYSSFFALLIEGSIPKEKCARLVSLNQTEENALIVYHDSREPETHASTLVRHKNKLFAAWFGGTREGNADVKIWLSSRDLSLENSTWSTPFAVASEPDTPHWNPVLFYVPSTDTIQLYYKIGTPIPSWYTRITESKDGGESWSTPVDLVAGDQGGRGPVKDKPILLQDGTILAGASIETASSVWDVFTDSSSDGGKTWKRSEFAYINHTTWPGEGAIQPSLLDFGNGTISMLCRSSSNFTVRADSHDNGKTWGAVYLTKLPNNNSGLDSLRMENGDWLVVHNPVQENRGPRTPLVVSRSIDEGATWNIIKVLENKPRPVNYTRGESEFSYPAIIHDGFGGAFVSYTYERQGIKHYHLSAEELGYAVKN